MIPMTFQALTGKWSYIIMSLPSFTLREMLEAGVHFGHHPRRWNPKMEPFIFGVRNGVHIVNLEKTAVLLKRALKALHETVSQGGRVLFVGTKRQASDVIAQEALRCGQYYVNQRWLGGMMTNWGTVSKSIRRLKELKANIDEGLDGLTKKEGLKLTRDHHKLEMSLGGIKDLGGLPDILFILDTNKEKIAIQEAQKLGIPVIAVLDTNSDPDGIDFPIPGNDDAIRSIEFYCRLMADTTLAGLQDQMRTMGVDLGASEKVMTEDALDQAAPKAKAQAVKDAADGSSETTENKEA